MFRASLCPSSGEQDCLRLHMVFACNTGKKMVRCSVVAVLSCDHSRALCMHVRMACGIAGIETILESLLIMNKHQITATSSWFYYLPIQTMHGHTNIKHEHVILNNGLKWL
jgi:hypothetical protein